MADETQTQDEPSVGEDTEAGLEVHNAREDMAQEMFGKSWLELSNVEEQQVNQALAEAEAEEEDEEADKEAAPAAQTQKAPTAKSGSGSSSKS